MDTSTVELPSTITTGEIVHIQQIVERSNSIFCTKNRKFSLRMQLRYKYLTNTISCFSFWTTFYQLFFILGDFLGKAKKTQFSAHFLGTYVKQLITARITEEYLNKKEKRPESLEDERTTNMKRKEKRSAYCSHTSARSILKKHTSDFWENFSLPGFKYVGEPGKHSLDRYVWLLVLFVSIFVSSKYIRDSYNKWQESPVLLSFNDSLTPISSIPFPAVTFCPARQLGNNYDLESNLQTCKTSATCPSEQWTSLLAAVLLCPKSEHFPKGVDNVTYYDGSLKDNIRKISSTCGEDMGWFKLNGDDYSYNCSLRFQTLFIDGSVCFTFNMLPARDLFNDFVVSPMFDNTDVESKPGWSLDTMLQSADLSQTVPRYIDSNGQWAGLYFSLYRVTRFEYKICEQSSTDVKMVFHHPAEIPHPETHTFYKMPDRGDLFIQLHPSLVTASKELLDYSPKNRKCYFSHERKLSLFRIYTQRNCQLECKVNCSLSLCDCVPFYLPRLNDSIKICGRQRAIHCADMFMTAIVGERYTWKEIVLEYREWLGDRIQEKFRGYEYSEGGPLNGTLAVTDELLKATYPDCKCDCPSPCTSLTYNAEIHQQPLPSESYDDDVELTRPAIYFKEPEFTTITRKELIGLTDFIADSGGVLGVFTGFSFLALVEILYYLTLRLWKNIKHSWNVLDPLLDKE